MFRVKKNYVLIIYSRTIDDAKQKAFEYGVEFALGSLLLTETTVSEGELIKDKITEYSAGYIDDYSFIEVEQSSDKMVILIAMGVSESKLVGALQSCSMGELTLKGDVAASRMNSYKAWSQDSVERLTDFLTSYPQDALELEILNTKLSIVTRKKTTRLAIKV